MGSLIGYSILPRKVSVEGLPIVFRNADGRGGSNISAGSPSVPNYTTASMSQAQIDARKGLSDAIQVLNSAESDKAVLGKLITDVKKVCSQKPSGWKNQVLKLVENSTFKGLEWATIGVASATVFFDPLLLAAYSIITAVKKKQAAEEICSSVYESGQLGIEYSNFDSKISAQKKTIRSLQYLVDDTDAAEAKFGKELADNAARMNLAATASEREKYRQESARLQEERDSKILELKSKQRADAANLRMQRADAMNDKTLIIGGVVLLALGGISYFILKGQ